MYCIKVGHSRSLSLSILLFAVIIQGFIFIAAPSMAALPQQILPLPAIRLRLAVLMAAIKESVLII